LCNKSFCAWLWYLMGNSVRYIRIMQVFKLSISSENGSSFARRTPFIKLSHRNDLFVLSLAEPFFHSSLRVQKCWEPHVP
jgi:hypothetical protein